MTMLKLMMTSGPKREEQQMRNLRRGLCGCRGLPRWAAVVIVWAAAVGGFGWNGGLGVAFGQSQSFTLTPDGDLERVDAPTPGSDAALIAEARRQLAEDRPGRALELLDPFLSANENTNNPHLAAAYLARGDARVARGDEFRALYDYEALIRRFPASPEYVRAIDREREIAERYVRGLRRRFFGLRIMSAESIGEELLIRVQERLPGSPTAERAGMELAEFYFRKGDLKLAAEAYELFLQNYPNSANRAHAMKGQIVATVAKFKGPRYDTSSLLDARALIRRFEDLYPAEAAAEGLNDALVMRLEESAAGELLELASYYLRREDGVSARLALRRLLRDYPATEAAIIALATLEKYGWTIVPERDPWGRQMFPMFENDSGVDAGVPVDATPAETPLANEEQREGESE